MSLAISLRTKVCCVCGEPIEDQHRISSGHYRATDCDGQYIAVFASWHDNRGCDAVAQGLPHEPGSERGCLGPLAKWMDVEVETTYESPFDPMKREGGR